MKMLIQKFCCFNMEIYEIFNLKIMENIQRFLINKKINLF